MLIATFGPSTGWVGKTIAFDGQQFILEGVGPVLASAVLEYARLGNVTWASSDTQQLTQAMATTPAGSSSPAWRETHRWLGTPTQLIILAVVFVVFAFLWTIVSQMH